MVKVSVEVRSKTARFRVMVHAESVRRALSLVAGRYPSGTWRVRFPIEAEGASGENLIALAGRVEMPEGLAA